MEKKTHQSTVMDSTIIPIGKQAKWGFLFSVAPKKLYQVAVDLDLSKTACRLLLLIVDRLNGRTKDGWTIPLSDEQIALELKKSISVVCKTRKELIRKGVLFQHRIKTGTRVFRFNTDLQNRPVSGRSIDQFSDDSSTSFRSISREEMRAKVLASLEETDSGDASCKDIDKDITIKTTTEVEEEVAEKNEPTETLSVPSETLTELLDLWEQLKGSRLPFESRPKFKAYFEKTLKLIRDTYDLEFEQALSLLQEAMSINIREPDTPLWYIKHFKGLNILVKLLRQHHGIAFENPENPFELAQVNSQRGLYSEKKKTADYIQSKTGKRPHWG